MARRGTAFPRTAHLISPLRTSGSSGYDTTRRDTGLSPPTNPTRATDASGARNTQHDTLPCGRTGHRLPPLIPCIAPCHMTDQEGEGGHEMSPLPLDAPDSFTGRDSTPSFTALHYTALHYTTLPYAKLHHITLHYGAGHDPAGHSLPTTADGSSLSSTSQPVSPRGSVPQNTIRHGATPLCLGRPVSVDPHPTPRPTARHGTARQGA
jgi:hypothetical protein